MTKKFTKTIISIDIVSILQTVGVVLALGIAFLVKEILLGILIAAVIASGVEPIILVFSRYKIPRVVTVTVAFAIFMALAAIMSFFLVPIFVSETTALLVNLPDYVTEVELVSGDELGQGVVYLSDVIGDFSDSLTGLEAGDILGTISSLFGGLFSALIVLTIAFYLAVQKDGVADFLRLVTPLKQTDYVVNVWRRSQLKIGLWMQGQIFSGLMAGVLTYIGLVLLGAPFPFIFAVLAAVFELVPIFGPVLAAFPAIALSMGQGGFAYGMIVALFYVIMQQFQSNILYPLVVNKVIGIPPIIVVIAIGIGFTLGGFMGVILSVPAAAVIIELVNDYKNGHKESKRALLELEEQIMYPPDIELPSIIKKR